MATTTKPPWVIEPVFIAQSDGEALHFGEYRFPHERTDEGHSRVYSREEAQANARLIAAAPELFALAEKLTKHLAYGDPLLDEAEAVIRKAKGES